MKNKLFTICTSILLMSTASMSGDETRAAQASKDFARMKTLVGAWKGQTDMGQGPIEMTVQYRLLAAGTVLEERAFAGTPNEMLTMYYEKDGKLALTHYCMIGNRPEMILNSSDSKSLRFDFDKNCGINPAKESHMHALTITFDDADTITASCKAIMDGKALEEHPTTLKRIER
ncbi:MAG TPA: hypothetical protein VK633_03065 [Verrucomicrobiae bacterium]|nr:hypothetical protein [Verrucomicrobiae bacterium]